MRGEGGRGKGTHQDRMYDALEEGDPGMALVHGALVPVALERVWELLEASVGPIGDAAGREKAGRGVWEKEIRETGVEGALGGYVPAEGDVVDATESEIRLPLEGLDVGAESGCGGAGGRDAKGGLGDGGRGRDGVRVEREAREQGGQCISHGGGAGSTRPCSGSPGTPRASQRRPRPTSPAPTTRSPPSQTFSSSGRARPRVSTVRRLPLPAHPLISSSRLKCAQQPPQAPGTPKGPRRTPIRPPR